MGLALPTLLAVRLSPVSVPGYGWLQSLGLLQRRLVGLGRKQRLLAVNGADAPNI